MTAGGRLTAGRWRDNTQYLLSSTKDSNVLICLSTPLEEEETKIGFYVTEANKYASKLHSITEDLIVKKAPFRKASETYCSLKLQSDRKYNIIPCTFSPGVCVPYTITVYSLSDSAISLSPIHELSCLPITVRFFSSFIIIYQSLLLLFFCYL